ncbi:unnamed protein product [Effrenium voratum]|uniref:tRNA:m(4)X modification enzyme TRM13 n=1 Tax=Effrenium voratum TaxID=2562239 RepID=A0AA36IKA8_9DINO|nr:unnamed protein product [Effrenium voratum]
MEDWMPVLSFEEALEAGSEEASRPSVASRRRQKREERNKIRLAHDKARTRELRATHQVLQALHEALPAFGHKSGSDETAETGSRKSHPTEEEVDAQLLRAAEILQVESPYRGMPQVFAPPEGLDILLTMIDRPPKYQEKYLSQEWSLISKVWALAGEPNLDNRRGLAVVDIGAGNGSLALLAALLLDGHAVLIDHTLPPEPLRVEERLPEIYKRRVLRITGDVGELDASRQIEPLLEEHGIQEVVVIAKHLCGVGTDLALKLLRRWCNTEASKSVAVLGAAIATCCGHKIGAEDKHIFAEIHSEDPYLRHLTGDADRLLSFLSICTRCVAWRTTANALANRITDRQVLLAELFEDALQQPRSNLLKSIFPAATEVAFVPSQQSPQNRCLLAGSQLGVKRALAGESSEALMAALIATRDALLQVNGGAFDLRPHGMASTRICEKPLQDVNGPGSLSISERRSNMEEPRSWGFTMEPMTRGRRGGTAPRQHKGRAPKGRRSVSRSESRPGWDEDTRAPSLFDTQLRTIFQSYRRERDRADRAAAGNPRRARERERAASQVQHTQHAHHRPGQLRRRLQGTMRRASSPGAANSFRASQESLRESFRESVRESVGESVRGSVRESVRDSADFVELARPIWDAPPPPLLAQRPPIWEPVAAITPLPTQPVPPAPELLGVAHVQRTRSASSLEQRLAILLPDAKPIRQDVLVCQSKPAAAVHMETEPPQVRSLSQRLSALLGESQGRKQHDARCGKELLWQNSSKVIEKADLLTDQVLEHILGDAVRHLDTLPDKRRETDRSVPGVAGEVEVAPDPPDALSSMVQTAADKLQLLEHELRMAYGDRPEAGCDKRGVKTAWSLSCGSRTCPDSGRAGSEDSEESCHLRRCRQRG